LATIQKKKPTPGEEIDYFLEVMKPDTPIPHNISFFDATLLSPCRHLIIIQHCPHRYSTVRTVEKR